MASGWERFYFSTDEQIVSVWAAKVPVSEIPEDYFEEHYYDDDEYDDDGEIVERPFNQFSWDFGFGFYDYDFVETMGARSQAIVDFSEIIARVSFSQSFFEPACAAATAVGCEQTAWIIVIYNFKYDPSVTGTTETEFMRFVGAFPFDENAGPVCDPVHGPPL